ncbi:hypothetical protein QFZ81_004591 [Paenibacillus sp. V4I9]|nr:hypothetical protein [Paenibacillus sp. V4I9]
MFRFIDLLARLAINPATDHRPYNLELVIQQDYVFVLRASLLFPSIEAATSSLLD